MLKDKIMSVKLPIAVAFVIGIIVGVPIGLALQPSNNTGRFTTTKQAGRMFDSRTGQTCLSSSVTYDDLTKVEQDMHHFAMMRDDLPPNFDYDPLLRPHSSSELLDALVSKFRNDVNYREFIGRYDALSNGITLIYHYNDMPYCSELLKR